MRFSKPTRKPFDALTEGLISKDSRGDWICPSDLCVLKRVLTRVQNPISTERKGILVPKTPVAIALIELRLLSENGDMYQDAIPKTVETILGNSASWRCGCDRLQCGLRPARVLACSLLS